MTRISDRSPPQARHVVLAALIALAAFLAGAAAQADQHATTQVVADETNGTVRIVVQGRDIVTIDAQGLHVSGDISYTGTANDTGGAP